MTIATDGKGNYLRLDESGEWVKTQVAEDPRTGTRLIKDGDEWKPEPGQEPSVIGSALRGIVRGATFGFNDELRAATDAAVQGAGNLIHGSEGRPSMGETYEKSLARNREIDRLDAATNPGADIAGQVYGGVGSAVLMPVGAAARVAAPVLGSVNALLPALPNVVRQGARMVAGGAASGAASGFGASEGGFSNRVEGATLGGAVGGAVAPVVGGIASAVPAVAGRVGHVLGLRDAQLAADRKIIQGLDRAGVTVDDAGTRLAAQGDVPVGLVDVGGRNTVNLAATAANTPSRALDVADAFVENRRIGRPDRLMNAGDAAFGGGSGTDVAEQLAALRTQRSTEAAPLYREAFGKPAGMTDAMQTVLDDPITASGLKRGLEIQRIENTARRARGEAEIPATDPAIYYDELGDPRIRGVPNMRTLDAVKRGLDAIMEDARDPTSGRVKWDERLHAIDDLRRTWVGLLDEGNPAYAEARAAWGGPSAQMEAIGAGRTALRTDRDIVAQRATSGPPDVQQAYRFGAGRDFADRVSDPARASGAARAMLEDHQMQARLGSLLGPDGLRTLNDALRRETQMTAVERAVSPRAGSQTARLTAGGSDMANDVAGPLVTAFRQVTSGHPWQGAATAGSALWRSAGQGINPSTANALADRLFATDPAARAQVVAALRNRLLQDELATQRWRAVAGPVLRGLSTTAGRQGAQD